MLQRFHVRADGAGIVRSPGRLQGKRNDLFFYRDSNGNEVDLIAEQGRSLAAIEIKAGATVNPDYFKGLRQLKKLVGEIERSRIGLREDQRLRPGVAKLSRRASAFGRNIFFHDAALHPVEFFKLVIFIYCH
jgi:hypothetical protein